MDTAMDTARVKQFINEWIEQNKGEFIDCAEYIFDNPELGMQEFKAVKILTDLAAKHGFKVETGVAGMPTAFVATYGGGKPVIAFSVEYDCLPGLSQKVSPAKDPVIEGAPGHGCGHNLLGTTALEAGIAFRYAMEKFALTGAIKMFGTPAEETCIGKPFMARAGLFDDVDAFLDWHPSLDNTMVNKSSNAYFNKYYHFKGKTAHGNSPWNGRSALDACVLMGHAAEILREHVKPGIEGAATFNTFNYTFSDVGPEFPSVVPDKSTIWFVGRFSSTDVMSDAMERLDKCAEGAALATGTTVKSELVTAIHEKIPNDTLAQVVHDNYLAFGQLPITEEEHEFAKGLQKNAGLEPAGIVQGELPPSQQDTYVSDNSEYSWIAPTAMFLPAIYPGPLHHWTITATSGSSIGKKAIGYTAKILANSAVDLIANPDVLAAAQEELKKRLGGHSYKSLIPDEISPPLDANKQIMEKYKTRSE
ncbi:MAG: amidohydrolase [Synergistaceae bacterium]|jgi:aminobenzoyl-glutamate utilization protein B|nr:amidohydrolase [Synergistaceae bacterium]